MSCLDVAGGTGDISFKILEKSRRDNPFEAGLSVDITVSDINPDMLEVGKKRAIEQGIYHDLKF
jgi:ubiquinone/menaquinone biosynthesis C-methylase UbiE